MIFHVKVVHIFYIHSTDDALLEVVCALWEPAVKTRLLDD